MNVPKVQAILDQAEAAILECLRDIQSESLVHVGKDAFRDPKAFVKRMQNDNKEFLIGNASALCIFREYLRRMELKEMEEGQ